MPMPKENLRPILRKYPFLINLAAFVFLVTFPISGVIDVLSHHFTYTKFTGFKEVVAHMRAQFEFLLEMVRYDINQH